jgi:hypothetical protein
MENNAPARRLRRKALIVVAIFCMAVAGYAILQRSRVSKLFGGSQNIGIVSDPTRVETYRLGGLPPEFSKNVATPFDYQVSIGPVPLPASHATAVSSALRSGSSYGWYTLSECRPSYGTRLSFLRDDDQVDVYLCFKCNILTICRDGKVVGEEDFDDIRPVLVRAVKACFPNDSQIQALNEDRADMHDP